MAALIYDDSKMDEFKSQLSEPFEDCEFRGLDFTEQNLKASSFFECRFIGCNFANQILTNSSMRDVSFESCNLVGVNWCSLKRFENAKFLDSKLSFSTFQGLKLKNIEIIKCQATDCDFSEADLSHADFSGSTLGRANFERANLTGADFRSSRDYVFDVRTARIRGAKFSFPDVISLLTALGIEVDL